MLEPGASDIDIWLVDDRKITDVALLEQYQAMLSADENARLERLVFARHKHQFLVTRALLRTVLSRYLQGWEPASLVFSTSVHGKPYLEVAPKLQFNLTHTNGLAALAVSAKFPVGIDVEYQSRVADVIKLTERYFAAGEAAALHELPIQDWNTRFYDLWTLKEAYLKACGTGLRTPLRDFCFDFNGADIGISFSESLHDDPAAWRFWQMSVANEYRLSLALYGSDATGCSINARQGVPLGEFADVALPVVRTGAHNT